QARRNCRGRSDIKSPAHHGALKAGEKGQIVIDQQKAGICGQEVFDRAHAFSIFSCALYVKTRAADCLTTASRLQTIRTCAWPSAFSLAKVNFAPVRSSKVLA